MIARILSRLSDLRDARQLARTVHVQAEQIDALTVLNEHLAEQLEVAETAAEEYRARLSVAPYTPGIEHSTAEIGEGLYRSWEAHAAHGGEPVDAPRDAQTIENRVLSLTSQWAADRERDTAARLTAAEVELARLTADVRACHEALAAAGVPFVRGATVLDRIGLLMGQRREMQEGWSVTSANLSKMVRREGEALNRIEGLRIGLEAAVERGRRWERHARALAGVARFLFHTDKHEIDWLRGRFAEHVNRGRDTAEHDAPPPTQPSERRAAAPPSPPRFRVTAGGDR